MAHEAAKAEAVVPVKADFIGRSLASPAVLQILKAAAWTNVFALSQALGTSYFEGLATARKAGAALDIASVKRQFIAKTKVFYPSVFAHTAAFLMIRGTGDTRGLYPMVMPLAIVAAPTIAYTAYYRAQPPQALRFGVASCVVLHLYDRVWKPTGILESEMPTTRLHRQIW